MRLLNIILVIFFVLTNEIKADNEIQVLENGIWVTGTFKGINSNGNATIFRSKSNEIEILLHTACI